MGATATATANNGEHTQLTSPPCLKETVVASDDNAALTEVIENVDSGSEEDTQSAYSCEVNDDLI